MANPRKILSYISAALLAFLVYVNIRAIKKDWHRGNGLLDSGALSGRSGFLRILAQSITSTSDSVVDANDPMGGLEAVTIDETDKLRIKDIEEKLPRLNEFVDELKAKIRSLQDELPQLNEVVADLKSKSRALKENSDSVPSSDEEPQKVSEEKHRRQHDRSKSLTGYNILLLYADDWTHHTLSAFHKTEPINKVLKTPILDALAQDGIRFTHNCVTTSVCWVSRATLFTGQYMSRHNTTEPCCWSGMEKPTEKLKEAPKNWNELSVYELLASNGYHVGHAGKWGVYMPWPKQLDFNVEDDGWHWRQVGNKLWHITEKNEADALRFLVTRPKDKPFFLNVAFFATHAKDGDKRQYMPQNESMTMYEDDTIPIPSTDTDEAWKKMPFFFGENNEGRTRWRWRYQNYTLHQSMMKNYYRMATEVDSACGAILEELRRQGELDNTVVIFTTDNGNFHGEHGLADKWYPHQESIRVPLIIRDPRMKNEKRGTINDAFTLNIDLAPTILGAAGVLPPEQFMGRDISELYLSQSDAYQWRTEFFYEHPVISKANYIPASEALVRKDYKYMYWPNFDYEQLFDLVNDPGELDDIFNSTDPDVSAVKKEMKARFDQLKRIVKSDQVVTL